MNRTLKKALKRYALLEASKINARKVLKPPLKTGGPIIFNVVIARSAIETYLLSFTKNTLSKLLYMTCITHTIFRTRSSYKF